MLGSENENIFADSNITTDTVDRKITLVGLWCVSYSQFNTLCWMGSPCVLLPWKKERHWIKGLLAKWKIDSPKMN